MDIETRLEAALAAEGEAAALYHWMSPDHRAEFVDFVRGEAPEGVQGRIAEVVAILAGGARLDS